MTLHQTINNNTIKRVARVAQLARAQWSAKTKVGPADSGTVLDA